ncbi:hypothetical protein F511_03518 [Dorcoceras hygrometricum]|uniref:Uncharacterized protein n=1 Tax=Dorcoceras hygrometricum TaxID=472368 RepID=A0A2Z7AH78_9LAMI|nr:hypothetical protein F511_03518 [Dorcoceras hygrometricum]
MGTSVTSNEAQHEADSARIARSNSFDSSVPVVIGFQTGTKIKSSNRRFQRLIITAYGKLSSTTSLFSSGPKLFFNQTPATRSDLIHFPALAYISAYGSIIILRASQQIALHNTETLKKCKQVTQPASWCVAEVLGRSLRAVGSGLYKWLYKSNRLVNPSSNERRGDVGD